MLIHFYAFHFIEIILRLRIRKKILWLHESMTSYTFSEFLRPGSLSEDEFTTEILEEVTNRFNENYNQTMLRRHGTILDSNYTYRNGKLVFVWTLHGAACCNPTRKKSWKLVSAAEWDCCCNFISDATVEILTLCAPILQNGHRHSNNSNCLSVFVYFVGVVLKILFSFSFFFLWLTLFSVIFLGTG